MFCFRIPCYKLYKEGLFSYVLTLKYLHHFGMNLKKLNLKEKIKFHGYFLVHLVLCFSTYLSTQASKQVPSKYVGMQVLKPTYLWLCTTYIATNIYIYNLKIINMPCGKIIYCAMFHNFGPSLTIIMDDGDQYFKKKKVQNVHNATCQFLING